MVTGLLPAGVNAAGTTIPGSPETVTLGTDAAVQRENSFNKGWRFCLGDNAGASKPNFDDSAWENVNLPHDFSITQSFTSSGEAESGFLPGGTGWYRKRFVLSEDHADKTFLLNFGGVYSDAYVYVNGNFAGEHHYGYTGFAFDITNHLVCDDVTQNVVAVKAVNHIPSSRWYSGSGIYRDVTLWALERIHVDLYGVTITTPGIAEGDGTALVRADVVNDGFDAVEATVIVRINAKGDDLVAAQAGAVITAEPGTTQVELAPAVYEPLLWSIEAPRLYTLTLEISVDGQVVDTFIRDFGYRWFAFDSSGFHLNGKAVKLNGVCMHHDQGGLGSAAYYDAMYRQLSIMKDMGANAIRTAHNPADEQYIQICSELGLLVIEETFDGLVDPKNSNVNDFSKYFEKPASDGLYGWRDGMTCAEYAARSIVRRDRNAPSIIAWSFGNEIQEGTYWTNISRYADLCAGYIGWVNDEDGTRPVTSGDNNRGDDRNLVNVIRTITENGGIAGFNYANSAATLYNLARSYGGSKGVIIASETSSATNSRSRYQSQRSNSSIDGAYHLTSFDTSAVPWGITAHDSIYNTFQHDCVAGEFVWTGFDYIGEPTPWNGTTPGDSGRGAIPNSSYFGIVETTGFAKDTYYLYRSQWNKNAATVHLVTAWDANNQYLSGGKTPVWLYSNAPKVELYLNGTLLGTALRTAVTSPVGHTYYTYTSESNSDICSVSNGSGADTLYAVFHIVYTPGTLTARAYDENGNEIALDDSMGRHTVSTPGSVARLAAAADKTEIKADGQSLLYVQIDVTDASGNPDTTASNSITFSLDGPAVIAAVDNGDQATRNKYQQASVLTSCTCANINAYAGKALVILRSTEVAGSVKLTIESDGLEGRTIPFTTLSDDETAHEGLASYEMIRDYSVKAGTSPQLETAVTGFLADGTTVSGTIEWDSIPAAYIGNPDDYTITGTAAFAGFDAVRVTARLHVIPHVIALRNISAATMENTAPTLPGTVRGVLADGTLAGTFSVVWDAPEASAYANVGDIVIVTGTALVFGNETLDVTCTVRVAEAVNTESANVAPMADSLSQDIPADIQSDHLNSVIGGGTITLTWATAQTLSDINLYYRYDSACRHPDSVVFRYSLNGTDFVEAGASGRRLDVAINHGAAYTYALDEVINPVALQIAFPQPGGTSVGKCVDLYKIEAMTYAASLERNGSADLSSISLDGAPIEGFDPHVLTCETERGEITAETSVNAGITLLPEYKNVIRILTISEDGAAEKVYELHLPGNRKNPFGDITGR